MLRDAFTAGPSALTIITIDDASDVDRQSLDVVRALLIPARNASPIGVIHTGSDLRVDPTPAIAGPRTHCIVIFGGWSPWRVALGCYLILLLSTLKGSPELRKLDQYFGNLSYPIYLCHFNVGVVVAVVIAGDRKGLRPGHFFKLRGNEHNEIPTATAGTRCSATR